MFKTLICAAFAATFTASMACADDSKEKAAKLLGSYTIVSGERDGKALPVDHFKDSIVIITADKIVGTDKDKKQLFSCTYKVDDSTTPMKITMKMLPMGDAPKDFDARSPETPGLIAADDVNVKIIYALPDGETPTDFKTKGKQDMFVLKRVDLKK